MWRLLLVVLLAGAAAAEPVVSRQGWSFDRAEMNWYKWAKPDDQQKRGDLGQFEGWVEYDFEVPAAAWYALWVTGQPTTWGFSATVDGTEVWPEQGLTRADYENPDAENFRARGAQKKGNLYLTAGKHTLHLQRENFPGKLPNSWELRSAAGPVDAIRGRLDVPRVQLPGSEWAFTVLSGAPAAGRLEIVARNPVAGTETVVATVTLPDQPGVTATPVAFKLPAPGAWRLVPRCGDTSGRPADLIGGMVVESKVIAPPAFDPATVVANKLALAGVFADEGVLQQEKPLPVWGYAPPGKQVTVTLAGQEQAATADDRGRWRVTFAPLKAGGDPVDLVAVCGQEKAEAKGLLVGEVWVFGGQSNMGGSLSHQPEGEQLIATVDFPSIRIRNVHELQPRPDRPQVVRADAWSPVAPHPHRGRELLGKVNAISFGFARDVHTALKVPVGIIINNRGGTVITAWTSLETQEKTPAFAPEVAALERTVAGHLDLAATADTVNSRVQQWQDDTAAGKNPKAVDVEREVGSAYGREHKNDPAGLHAALVAPLAPYAIRGFAWYQGESDSRHAERYRQMLPAMIANWRGDWQDPKLPFLIVQIAPGSGDPPAGPPEDSKNAELRAAQAEVAATVPGAALAVTNDLPVPGDQVHYKNKLPIGHRLASIALGMVYGRDVVTSGPVYREQRIEGNTLRLSFDHLGGGLRVDGDTLRGFSIAGKDRVFHWADARIDGDTVVVSSPDVPDPVAARYAWCDDQPGATLKNAAGLPAPTFRTDDWPLSTRDN